MSIAILSPDGKRLATASSDKTAKVWDLDSGAEVMTLSGHSDEVFAAVFSPDGTRLATSAADRSVKFWDARTGEELLTFKGQSDRYVNVAFSPDGTRLVSARANRVTIWNAPAGRKTALLRGHSELVLRQNSAPTALESPPRPATDSQNLECTHRRRNANACRPRTGGP